jgi:hypothetical protein
MSPAIPVDPQPPVNVNVNVQMGQLEVLKRARVATSPRDKVKRLSTIASVSNEEKQYVFSTSARVCMSVGPLGLFSFSVHVGLIP